MNTPPHGLGIVEIRIYASYSLLTCVCVCVCVCVCTGDDVRALNVKDTVCHESCPQGQDPNAEADEPDSSRVQDTEVSSIFPPH